MTITATELDAFCARNRDALLALETLGYRQAGLPYQRGSVWRCAFIHTRYGEFDVAEGELVFWVREVTPPKVIEQLRLL